MGRDIEYRELELRRSEENVWQLVSDSRTQPEQLEGQIVVLLSAFMSSRTKFIGTPTELSEKIDPDKSEGVTPKKKMCIRDRVWVPLRFKKSLKST